MSLMHLVTDAEKEGKTDPAEQRISPWLICGYMVGGAVLLAAVGTWLVWFAISVQRTFDDEAIRAACERTMPEKVQRCVDTVILQRGGGKR